MCRPSSEKENEMLSRLNVDDLPQAGLQVIVVHMNPSGNVIVRIPRGKQTKCFFACHSKNHYEVV